MAKFELKFLDSEKKGVEISTEVFNCKEIEIRLHVPNMTTSFIYLDKSTAIKFAKTLRTEINKITESEVNNG
jgi:hypothetical protein